MNGANHPTAPRPLRRVDYPSLTDPEARAAYAAGLRHLADVIESDPDCPYVQGPVSLFIHSTDDQAEVAARLRRAFGGGKWEKKEHGSYLTLNGMCAGLPVNLWLDRDAVCERVVTGTREVVEEVPLGEDTRPVETVTRTEDVVEWVCSPLLAAADAAEATS